MLHRLSLYVLVVTFFIGVSVLPHDLGAEQFENKRVAKITIVPHRLGPDEYFDSSVVLTRMNTRVGDVFSQTAFDRDLKKLALDYDTIDPELE